MKKSRELEQGESLYSEFKRIADNLENHALNPSVKDNLSIASKKLIIFGDELGKNGEFFKKLNILKQKIDVKIQEDTYYSQFR